MNAFFGLGARCSEPGAGRRALWLRLGAAATVTGEDDDGEGGRVRGFDGGVSCASKCAEGLGKECGARSASGEGDGDGFGVGCWKYS